MKGDMELRREILIAMEEHEHGYAPQAIDIDGYTEDQIGYHIWLMGEKQAGLLKVSDASSMDMDSPDANPISMLWEGYEFLEAARKPERWEAATDKVKKTGAAMTFEILKAVLMALSKEALGLP